MFAVQSDDAVHLMNYLHYNEQGDLILPSDPSISRHDAPRFYLASHRNNRISVHFDVYHAPWRLNLWGQCRVLAVCLHAWNVPSPSFHYGIDCFGGKWFIPDTSAPCGRKALRTSWIREVQSFSHGWSILDNKASEVMQAIIAIVADSRFHVAPSQIKQEEERLQEETQSIQQVMWGNRGTLYGEEAFRCQGCDEWFTTHDGFHSAMQSHCEFIALIGRCPTPSEMNRWGLRRKPDGIWYRRNHSGDLVYLFNDNVLASLEMGKSK